MQSKGVQRVQKRCRHDFQKCTRSQSWTAPHSALAGAAGAAGAGILKKLFAIPKVFRLSINMPANKSTAPSPLMEGVS